MSQIKRRSKDLEAGRKVGDDHTMVIGLPLSLPFQEREKRRRRVLVQQMSALQEQEVLVCLLVMVHGFTMCCVLPLLGGSS